jgi:hypothetical protein
MFQRAIRAITPYMPLSEIPSWPANRKQAEPTTGNRVCWADFVGPVADLWMVGYHGPHAGDTWFDEGAG